MNKAQRPNLGLFTDLYELTMAQAYHAQGLDEEAVFDLYVRTLPAQRNYLVACGIESALRQLQAYRFPADALDYLSSLGRFSPAFLDTLANFRFRGHVDAVSEGTIVFGMEPILQLRAPIIEAQLVETLILNQVHFETVIASKGARLVEAAGGKDVIDFGARRAHGVDAGVQAARALYVAGFSATSNVLAGQRFGIPVVGTMAHSYIQAHADELTAFREFTQVFPETTLLVDTYDTADGVGHVIQLAQELGNAFRVRAIRLDSGDLAAHAVESRSRLDAAGLQGVRIVAGGGLDEHRIAALRAAPIDVFAVGTSAVTSEDAPALEAVYKLAAYGGAGRLKLSQGKWSLPGRKQVFRQSEGPAPADVIGLAGESLPGEPLLRPVMRDGTPLTDPARGLLAARDRARQQREGLPDPIRGLAPATTPYSVSVSPALEREQARVRHALGY